VLSDAAMARTIEALRICSDKMARRGVARSRLIATEACRVAKNAPIFIDAVRRETGLQIEIISRETEAKLAVAGCASLIDRSCDWALVFDIGGGSSELIWLDLRRLRAGKRQTLSDRVRVQSAIVAWTSLPVGVVTLAEHFGGRHVDATVFEEMVGHVLGRLEPFEKRYHIAQSVARGRAHLLGTSGTVTTLAGVHLGLEAYSRRKVDGCWLAETEVRSVTGSLLEMDFEARSRQPCIGPDRADLVLGGCAILEAMLRLWPCQRLRVADRGLREGILANLMADETAERYRTVGGELRRP
jgi:exopolyphosphatase/guanosine-5'-triphosphate,3'-diphosphate pyrophosphatase